MRELRITSCMAPIMDGLVEGVADFLSDRLGLAVKVVDQTPWRARELMFDRGEIDLCWICGLPYVWKADSRNPAVEALVAPVMSAARYGGLPVYFSDVVVRKDSPFVGFADLKGARWAYNEPGSHSGYNVVRCHLGQLGHANGYFESAVEAGSHQHALRLILNGKVDGAAIDSSVLELIIQRRPSIGERIRIVEVLGPSPYPPWIVPADMAHDLKASLREALARLHETEAGRQILAGVGMARLSPVADQDYDLIRQAYGIARGVHMPIARAGASLGEA